MVISLPLDHLEIEVDCDFGLEINSLIFKINLGNKREVKKYPF